MSWSRRQLLALATGGAGALVIGCARAEVGEAPATPARSAPTVSATTPTATPSAGPSLPPVRHDPSLPVLMRRTFASATPETVREAGSTSRWARYEVRYPSAGLEVSGVLYVPRGAGPIPGVVLAHGYIPPERYVTGQGMPREQEYLADRGFVVLHTDYRGHAASSRVEGLDLELRLAYAEDVLNGARALQLMGEVDPDRVAIFGRSMGGGVVANALVAAPGLVRAGVAWASVSSRFLDNVERWTRPERPERVAELEDRFGPLSDDNTFWTDLSSRTFFDRITVPVLLDYGAADATCPIDWSRSTAQLMQQAGVDVRLHERIGEDHTYTSQWQAAMDQTHAFLRTALGSPAPAPR